MRFADDHDRVGGVFGGVPVSLAKCGGVSEIRIALHYFVRRVEQPQMSVDPPFDLVGVDGAGFESASFEAAVEAAGGRRWS